MSHGTQFLMSLCVSDSGMQDFMRLSPEAEDFKGDNEKVLFEYLVGFAGKYGKMPSVSTVQQKASEADWGFSVPTALEETPEFYYDRVRSRRLHVAMKSALVEASSFVNAGNPEGGFEVLEKMMVAQKMRQMKNRLVNFASEGYEIIKSDLLAQAHGLTKGLMLGWPYLDGMTGGLMPGDVLSIVGRPAQGKTWALLYGAHHGWQTQGRVPLVISMEMNAKLVTQRLAAMNTSISLTHLKTGQLDTKKQLKPMMAMLKANKDKQPLYVVDGALAVNVPQIRMLIQQLAPTDVWIDGAYLLRHENNKLGRWEKVTDNAERIKGELAEGFGIPVVISYQFNREATKKKHGAPGVEDIGYTDAIGQLSSIVLGMMQPDSVETILRRKLSIMKGRSGEVGEFFINWSFNHPKAMDFSQWFEPTVAELSYL